MSRYGVWGSKMMRMLVCFVALVMVGFVMGIIYWGWYNFLQALNIF